MVASIKDPGDHHVQAHAHLRLVAIFVATGALAATVQTSSAHGMHHHHHHHYYEEYADYSDYPDYPDYWWHHHHHHHTIIITSSSTEPIWRRDWRRAASTALFRVCVSSCATIVDDRRHMPLRIGRYHLLEKIFEPFSLPQRQMIKRRMDRLGQPKPRRSSCSSAHSFLASSPPPSPPPHWSAPSSLRRLIRIHHDLGIGIAAGVGGFVLGSLLAQQPPRTVYVDEDGGSWHVRRCFDRYSSYDPKTPTPTSAMTATATTAGSERRTDFRNRKEGARASPSFVCLTDSYSCVFRSESAIGNPAALQVLPTRRRVSRSAAHGDEFEAASRIRVDLGNEGLVAARAAGRILAVDEAADHNLPAAVQRPLAGKRPAEPGGSRIWQALTNAGGDDLLKRERERNGIDALDRRHRVEVSSPRIRKAKRQAKAEAFSSSAPFRMHSNATARR